MSLPPYLLGFDTETTGVDVHNDRIVTASAVLMDQSDTIIEQWEWLINPGVEIPEGASDVHGVTTEHAQMYGASPTTSIYEIAYVVSHYMNNGVPVVAYNASYDFSILNSECYRHLGYWFTEFFMDTGIPPYIIDPYVIDKRIDTYRRGSRTLTTTAEVYGVSLDNAHASYDDCVAAVGVLRAMWDKYKFLDDGPFEELYVAQQEWYKDQQQGLAEYFKKQGKEADINTIWPISTGEFSAG